MTDADLLLEAVLDSWDRNNTILVNLLRAVPPDAMSLRATEDGPTVAQLFMHAHYVRLVFVEEDAPEHAPAPAAEQTQTTAGAEWDAITDVERMAAMLGESAAAVRRAVEGRTLSGRAMELHYDHPVLMLQHLIWHEGYHHGQIKLALKLAGQPLADRAIGAGTWGVWMRKGQAPVTRPS